MNFVPRDAVTVPRGGCDLHLGSHCNYELLVVSAAYLGLFLQVNGESRHVIYTLWVSSCEDPLLLYFCRIDSEGDSIALRYTYRTPSVIRNMVEGANLPRSNPKFTMINLIGEREMGLFIRLAAAPHDSSIPSALRLALHSPSANDWKKHLLLFIENLQVNPYFFFCLTDGNAEI
ncbi:unnamed protein product [Gongylonema pulchrum]|uniref:SH2 domain-containing protein n=1 Tax=Gongylonema pulchrum TaxID=637853 RepID=A0A183EG05_9BILA|nr:unnamed protein product [Gongylonema pulchrum]